MEGSKKLVSREEVLLVPIEGKPDWKSMTDEPDSYEICPDVEKAIQLCAPSLCSSTYSIGRVRLFCDHPATKSRTVRDLHGFGVLLAPQ